MKLTPIALSHRPQTTRMPESMFVTFAPVGSSDAAWEVNKLGEWVNIDNIISGGDQHMHSVYSGSG